VFKLSVQQTVSVERLYTSRFNVLSNNNGDIYSAINPVSRAQVRSVLTVWVWGFAGHKKSISEGQTDGVLQSVRTTTSIVTGQPVDENVWLNARKRNKGKER